MAYSLTWDATGYDFSDEVETIEWNDSSRIPLEIVPRRHGAIVTEDVVLEPRTLWLKGAINSSTVALAESRLNTLKKQMNAGAKQLRFDSTRQITAYKSSGDYNFQEGTGLRGVDYNLMFLAVDPFWYDITQRSVDQAITYSPFVWAHSNTGDAFVYPTISIIADGGGTVSNISINNLTIGKSITFTGTVASGKTLAIDMANFTALNDGVNVLNNMSGSWFHLASGSNIMAIYYTGSAHTVRMVYYPRWFGPAFQ